MKVSIARNRLRLCCTEQACQRKQYDRLQLLPRNALVRTGPVDHADWNYRPLLGLIIRRRYELAVGLLPTAQGGRILEVGFGSGIFLPELFTRCEELYGIDVHAAQAEVQQALKRLGIEAQLSQQSVTATDFPTSFFDCIVAVSALEFVDQIDVAAAEHKRIMRPEATLVVVTPGVAPILDFGLKLLTGQDPARDFGTRRHALVDTLKTQFTVSTQRAFPAFAPQAVPRIYTALRFQPSDDRNDRLAVPNEWALAPLA